MTTWHGLSDEAYDKIQKDAIRSKPVTGPIQDKLGAATYVLNYSPFKSEFILEGKNGQGDTVYYPPNLDPNSSSFWSRIPEVSRGPVTGKAGQFSGTYAEVAKHAQRLNQAESERSGGPVHMYFVELSSAPVMA